MKRRYMGSCHCGGVRFECALDLDGDTSRCNCSICAKSRFWKALVPAGDFRLLEGASMLTEYRFGSRTIRHLFCRRCGVKTFGRGQDDALGGEFVAVNIACLDEVAPEVLAQAPVRYEDGRHNRWDRAPARGSGRAAPDPRNHHAISVDVLFRGEELAGPA